MENVFYKFPKTPHIGGSSVVDDDESITPTQLKALFSKGKRIIIQEKVDGANVSVHFEQEWVPIPQKRSGLILTKEKQQYNVFRDWCSENMELLFSIVGTDHVLFGEVGH